MLSRGLTRSVAVWKISPETVENGWGAGEKTPKPEDQLGFSVGDQIRDEDSLGLGSGDEHGKEELL